MSGVAGVYVVDDTDYDLVFGGAWGTLVVEARDQDGTQVGERESFMSEAKALKRARALAAEHGVEVERV